MRRAGDRRLTSELCSRPAQILLLDSCVLLIVGLFASSGGTASAASVDEGLDLFRTGKYEECAGLAERELARTAWNEDWRLLKINAEMTLGRYGDALKTLEIGLERSSPGLELQLAARDVYRFNAREDLAQTTFEGIERNVRSNPYRYSSASSRVALGRYFLLRGFDAKKILDQFYDTAKRLDPDLLDAYYATAELALAKQDDALAADTLKAAPEEAAEDPRFHYLMASAFAESDRAKAAASLQAALSINPRHIDSLLMQVDQRIDAEQYDDAAGILDTVAKINPHEPRALAYRAVLAHLKADDKAEQAARSAALKFWKTNPAVDHLIGKKLSQKYRFAEGAAAQKRALEMDPDYRPAKLQLSQDLLRLGDEQAGWKLAEEVADEDAYNVVSFNLVTLREELDGYRTLRDGHFTVRMAPNEADLYGERVLALLHEAEETLGAKYDVSLRSDVVVEIFPRKKDFAVRTFGLPGADGFLGVCFGRVITINSPASRADHPSNWESVLWHEFCHTITLTKSRNKMPRWLSEGISVYEEGQRDPAWATAMNPSYREMLLGEDFTPLSELSSAFLRPKSGLHLQFAYFESALAVEFLVDRYGIEALKTVLDDLAEGIPLNDSLQVRTSSSIEDLDGAFVLFARERARSVAPNATWEEPELSPRADSAAIAAWLDEHPQNFYGIQRLAAAYLAEQNWDDAIESSQRMKELYPEYVGPRSAYELLATAYLEQDDTQAARVELETLASRDGSALAAYSKLMDIAEAEQDWENVAKNAERYLAVNPLVAEPYRCAARAAEQLDDAPAAIAAYRALSRLDDTDPAGVHFRLARLLHEEDEPDEALRHVLMSLEEAPRFQDAQRLLLDLVDAEVQPAAANSVEPVEAPIP